MFSNTLKRGRSVITVTNKRENLVHGFSLIELLIVVAILAVLAAVIAPQFSGNTKEAQESAVRSNLSALRSAIAMYQRDHGNVPPGKTDSSKGGTCAGAAAIIGGGGGSEADFRQQLIYFTAANGATCDVKDATHKFGPYLPAGIPENPLAPTAKNEVTVLTAGSVTMSVTNAKGWQYDSEIGKVIVDTTGYENW